MVIKSVQYHAAMLGVAVLVTGIAAVAASFVLGPGPSAAGLAGQAALIALTVSWTRRAAPRAFPAVGWWLPLVVVAPAIAGALAAASGPISIAGTAGIVAIAAVVAAGRTEGGRRAALALATTGPLAAAIAIPVAGRLPLVLAAQAFTAILSTVIPLALTPSPTKPVRRKPGAPRRRRYLAAAAMGLALGAGYPLGAAVFPAHREWVPLTAFVVLGAAPTIRHAVRRAAQRLGGATAGAVLGSVLLLVLPVGVPALAVGCAVTILLAGSTLRARAYAWWAGSVTAALVLTDGGGSWRYDIVRVAALATGGALALLALAVCHRTAILLERRQAG